MRLYLESSITDWPGWADERYKRLEFLDRFLDGTIYNHLQYPFTQEETDQGKYIPIHERRPSVRYNIAAMVARICARKLFAGRHAPRILHPDKKVQLAVRRLIEEAKLKKLMPLVCFRGSIGAAALTFKIVGQGQKGKAVCKVWRAKWCYPQFDAFDNLSRLRIAYTAPGLEFLRKGFDIDSEGEPIDKKAYYWKVRDHLPDSDIDYQPIKAAKWDPLSPEKEGLLIPGEEVEHGLGFVQAEWFMNLADDSPPDGTCTWEDAIPIQIDLEYSASQLGRAVRYNASPQVVTKGKPLDFDELRGCSAIRAPQVMLMFESGVKDSDGTSTEAGDAHLLEMTGQGVKVGLDYVDKLRKFALEQIAAMRKDPDRVGSLITGKAMELLDEDLVDLVQELRTNYGDDGYLTLVKKLSLAALRAGHPLMEGLTTQQIDGLMLQWPRTYLPTPAEVQQLVEAMARGVEMEIIDRDKAKAYLENNIDFPEESANREVLEPEASDPLDGEEEVLPGADQSDIVPAGAGAAGMVHG